MKTRVRSGLTVLLLIAMVACKKSTLTSNGDEASIAESTLTTQATTELRSSVNGQGGITINNRIQHFAFQASIDKDGNVSGSWESKSPGQDVRTHGTINCMAFLDNNTAVLSGIITQIAGEGFSFVQVGDPVWFSVRDNGEGANAPPDEFTDYYLGLSGCYDYGVSYHSIEDGNIQVKP